MPRGRPTPFASAGASAGPHHQRRATAREPLLKVGHYAGEPLNFYRGRPAAHCPEIDLPISHPTTRDHRWPGRRRARGPGRTLTRHTAQGERGALRNRDDRQGVAIRWRVELAHAVPQPERGTSLGPRPEWCYTKRERECGPRNRVRREWAGDPPRHQDSHQQEHNCRGGHDAASWRGRSQRLRQMPTPIHDRTISPWRRGLRRWGFVNSAPGGETRPRLPRPSGRVVVDSHGDVPLAPLPLDSFDPDRPIPVVDLQGPAGARKVRLASTRSAHPRPGP